MLPAGVGESEIDFFGYGGVENRPQHSGPKIASDTGCETSSIAP